MNILILCAGFFYGVFCFEVFRRLIQEEYKTGEPMRVAAWLIFITVGWVMSPVVFLFWCCIRLVELIHDNW